MAANSKFDLCTQATALIGLGPVNSFDGGSDRDAIAGRLYDTTVMPLIESYPWHFTRVISASLNRLSEVPGATWAYYYQLPNAVEGIVWALYDDAAIDAAPFKHWERVGQKIATNATAIWIHYAALPEIAQMPRYFHQLAIYALAAAFAQPMKESAELAANMRAVAFGTPEQNGKGGLWSMATAADARGSPSTVQRDNPFIDCR
jgi:hypothetical protein